MPTSVDAADHAAVALFTAFEGAADAVVITSHDNAIRFFNAAAERLWGYSRADVAGQPLAVLIPAASRQSFGELETAMQHGAVNGRRDVRLARKDGSECWGAFAVSRLAYGGRTVNISFVREVTEDVQHRAQNAMLALVAEKTDRVVVVTDRELNICYVNQAFTDLFGYSLAEAQGRQPQRLLTGRYTDPEALQRLESGIRIDGHGDEELLVYGKNGEEIWISATVNADRDADGSVLHLVCVLVDITETKQIHSLQHNVLRNLANDMPVQDVLDDLCRRVGAIAPDAVSSVLHVDTAGRLHPLGGDKAVPAAFSEAIDGVMLGPDVGCCGAAAFRGEPVLSHDIATDPKWAPYKTLPLEAGLRACWSTPIKAKNGRVIGAFGLYFRETLSPTRWHQTIVEACVHLCALAIERHEARSEIARLAYFDALTGLPNRTHMHQILDKQIGAAAPDEPIAVMFLDIDHFKDINDTLGHPTGDELLVKVTQRLRQQLLPADTLSRQGGDEFVVVLPGRDHREAARTASLILLALLAPFQLGERLVPVSASIGISIMAGSAATADDLLKQADAAMYRAKQAGRATYRFFSADLNRMAEERLALSTALRQALQLGALRLHYQPQMRADGRLYGVEALARWTDAVLGEVPPSKFIPVAEEYGLIEQIGVWSLREACRQIAAWRAAGLAVPCVSVNLSPINFQNANLAALIDDIMDESGITPDMLMLEVTEGVVMNEHSMAVSMMEKIRQSGVRLSMDDFGTGYSSLSRLAHLPIRELKIDRSFISGIENGASAEAIARAIIRVGQSLDMTVVAEGVETDAQRRCLIDLGCDVIQGYIHSPALPAAELESWLRVREPHPAVLAPC